MPADFGRVKEIFLAAVEKADPLEREAYLREACGDDGLRGQVEALLRHHDMSGSILRVEMEDSPAPPSGADELLALDEALTRLAAADPEAAAVVQLRYFAGLSVEDAAQSLGVSRATAYRHWTFARAWLLRELGGDESA